MSKIVSNKNQLSRLVKLMEENPDFSKGICSKAVMLKKWAEFSVELNSLGPPERDSTKWQRVWADLKCKTKKKRTENKIEIIATGGGPNKLQILTDTEEAISALLHFDSCVDPPGTEFGLEQLNVEVEDEQQEVVVQQKVSTRRNLKENNNVHRLELLKKTNYGTGFILQILDKYND